MRRQFYFILFCLVSIIANAQNYPFLNPDLDDEQRAEDLCSRLTVEEKSKIIFPG